MTDDDAGDAACWLDRVCEDCGGFVEHGSEHRCRRAVAGTDATRHQGHPTTMGEHPRS
jgi:hypothetical protein